MSQPARLPNAETIERVRAFAERKLSAEEVATTLAIPVSEAEREEVLSLFDWFRSRYPTPAERLAYVRRAYERWARAIFPLARSSSRS